MTKKALSLAWKLALAALLTWAVGRGLIDNISRIDFSELTFDPLLVVAAFGSYVVYAWGTGWIWHWLGGHCGCPLPLRSSFTYWTYSQLAKYVPGKVFRVGYLAYAYRKHGHDLHKVSALTGLEFVGSIAGIVVLIAVCTVFAGADLPSWMHTAGAVLLVGSLVGLHPKILNFGLALLSRLARKPLDAFAFRYRDVLLSIPLYAFTYVALALSNWLLFASIFGFDGVPGFFLTTAVFNAANLAGALAFFSPGGIGAREAVLEVGLRGAMGASVSSLLTVVSRVWLTLCELALVGAVWVLNQVVASPRDPVSLAAPREVEGSSSV